MKMLQCHGQPYWHAMCFLSICCTCCSLLVKWSNLLCVFASANPHGRWWRYLGLIPFCGSWCQDHTATGWPWETESLFHQWSQWQRRPGIWFWDASWHMLASLKDGCTWVLGATWTNKEKLWNFLLPPVTLPLLDSFSPNHVPWRHACHAWGWLMNDPEALIETWIALQIQMFFGNGSFGYVCSNAAKTSYRAIQSGIATQIQTLNREQSAVEKRWKSWLSGQTVDGYPS